MIVLQDSTITNLDRFDKSLTSIDARMARLNGLGVQFGKVMNQAFDGIVLKGRNAGDVFRSIALDISQGVAKSAFNSLMSPVVNLATHGLKGLAGGNGFGGSGNLFGGMSLPTPFAKGGVIASPMQFPLDGGTGLAGERGAEAIMPLARGPDGRLGVAANGNTGLNVTFNVAATDVDSFRRSESQIAAMLARTVAQGQRNL